MFGEALRDLDNAPSSVFGSDMSLHAVLLIEIKTMKRFSYCKSFHIQNFFAAKGKKETCTELKLQLQKNLSSLEETQTKPLNNVRRHTVVGYLTMMRNQKLTKQTKNYLDEG